MNPKNNKGLFYRPLGKAAKAVIAFFAVTLGIPTLLLSLWLTSLVDLQPPDRCRINSVDEEHFSILLRDAKSQKWTVWPWLSDGLIKPSDPDGLPLESNMARKLLSSVQELTPRGSPADTQLAAFHAVMRSMNAIFLQRKEIPSSHQSSSPEVSVVSFDYIIPIRRLSPFCIFCVLSKNAVFNAEFNRDLATNRYDEIKINVIVPSFISAFHDSRPDVSYHCPSFPNS